MSAPFTQLSGSATPTRRFGAFLGRVPIVEEAVAPPIWVRTDHRMGRFAEPIPGVRYLEPVVIQLPAIWDIFANDYVVSDSPIDIQVELTRIIVGAWDALRADAGGVCLRMDSPSIGRTQDRLSAKELITLEIHPFIQAPDIFLFGPRRQAILEAERLLGISIE